MSPRSCSEQRHQAAAGFTLLETLVAISIVAVVLLTVYGVFASVSTAKERLEHDGELYQRARVIFDRLGRELRGVCPVGGPEQRGVLRAGLDGEGNPTLELTTSATARLGVQQTGIALIRYALGKDPESGAERALFRSERSALVSEEALRESGAMRLAAGVRELTWRFQVGNEWRSELDADRDGLPTLVEVSLTLTDSQGQPLAFRSAFDVPDIAWRRP